MKKRMIRILETLWCLPATILVWLFYILPVWLIGKDFKFERWFTTAAGHKAAIFRLQSKHSRYAKAWRDWYGWGGPHVILLRQDAPKQTWVHEGEHVDQMLRWGLFFYPAYVGESTFIFFGRPDDHPYLDNHFEKAARKRAGQRIDIPPNMWPQGPKDRWPWW